MLSSTAELQAYNQAPSTQPERVSIKSTLHIDRGKIIQGRDDATHQISVEARRKRKAQLATVPFCSSRGRADLGTEPNPQAGSNEATFLGVWLDGVSQVK